MEWIIENLEQWRSLVGARDNNHEYVLVNNTEKPIRIIVTNTENRTVIVIKTPNK